MREDYKGRLIWTIGHSTHPPDVFLSMLQSFNIQLLADVRRYPGSRRYPQFNKETLKLDIEAAGIAYMHFEDLGGRRQPNPNSINIVWKHPAFRGYADYIASEPFLTAIETLQVQAAEKHTAYMCSEAPWWRCHRSIISDYLKAEGWTVMHIIKAEKAVEHPYTSAATVRNGKLDYTGNSIRFE